MAGAGGPKDPEIVRVRVVVRGKVQGVFYRDTTRREAVALGVSGWVRNLPGGDVEAVFEGPAPAVHEMIARCRQGPRRAVVTGIDINAEEPAGEGGFRVVP